MFLEYKKDRRATLETSVIQSEEHVQAENDEFQKQRMILRYRLYGRDGVTKREFNKLVRLGIIKERSRE